MGKMNIMFIPKWRLWYKKFNIMNRVIGYVRVSSENQVEKDNSIRNQIKFIKKYCQDYDYELVDIFKDEGVSGLKKSRDGLNKIDVNWDQNNNTHNIQIHFILNLIKDKGELINKDIYKIKGGKNILNIDGINLRKFKNEISKKKESETTFYNYSTVTDFARFLGWSTLQSLITAI